MMKAYTFLIDELIFGRTSIIGSMITELLTLEIISCRVVRCPIRRRVIADIGANSMLLIQLLVPKLLLLEITHFILVVE